jgi:hypothetical protein
MMYEFLMIFAMTLSITTFSIATLSITRKDVALSITTLHIWWHYDEYRVFIVVLSVVFNCILSVVVILVC